jgi:UDP-N-acetylglucosamine 2-epimerase (non-hydrolysing)
VVLTDSGGIQEETTVLGIPCLTLRHNTERPITVSMGTSRLVGFEPRHVVRELTATLNAPMPEPVWPPLWDGHAAGRVADVLLEGALVPTA